MELEDGELVEDAAAAATPGASGMKNYSKIPIKAKHCWIPSPAPLGSNAKLCVLQAVLFWELLHHVVCTDYCSVAETLHWFNKKKKKRLGGESSECAGLKMMSKFGGWLCASLEFLVFRSVGD